MPVCESARQPSPYGNNCLLEGYVNDAGRRGTPEASAVVPVGSDAELHPKRNPFPVVHATGCPTPPKGVAIRGVAKSRPMANSGSGARSARATSTESGTNLRG